MLKPCRCGSTDLRPIQTSGFVWYGLRIGKPMERPWAILCGRCREYGREARTPHAAGRLWNKYGLPLHCTKGTT